MQHKLVMLMLSVVVALSLVFVGCVPETVSPPEVTPPEPEEVPPEEVPPPEKPIELTLSTMFPLSYTYILNPTFAFCEKVEERTNGRVKFLIYHSAQLYGGKEEFAAVGRGDIDVGIPHDIYHTGEVPALGITSLPFLFESMEEAQRILDAGLKDMVRPKVEEGNNCVLLGWTVFDPYQFYCKAPVKTAEDVKGKVWAVSGTTHSKAIELLAGSPVMMSSGELYLALQMATIDGCTRPLITGRGRKLYEVAEYLTICGFSPWGDLLIVNKAKWDTFPSDIQQIMRQAGIEWQEEMFKEAAAYVDESIDILTKEGMTVHFLSPEELARFREGMAPVYDWWLKEEVPDGQQYLDFVEAHR